MWALNYIRTMFSFYFCTQLPVYVRACSAAGNKWWCRIPSLHRIIASRRVVLYSMKASLEVEMLGTTMAITLACTTVWVWTICCILHQAVQARHNTHHSNFTLKQEPAPMVLVVLVPLLLRLPHSIAAQPCRGKDSCSCLVPQFW